MKKITIIILLIAGLSITFAINKDLTKVQTTIIDNDKPAVLPPTTEKVSNYSGNPYPLMQDYGRTEVIGGTCYDWVNGPVMTWLVNDPNNGIHATWLWSNTEALTDRNMYYNFYDWTTRTWSWINPTNYMLSGQAVFPHTVTSVAGGADLDKVSGNFVISANYVYTGVLSVKLARDQSPGSGLFEYSQGPTGYRWPTIGVTQNQNVHIAAINALPSGQEDSLYYSRTTTATWPTTWTPYIKIPPPQPDPFFPDHNIAASKNSNKVLIVWEASEDAYPKRVFYRLSTNGGVSWDAPTQLPFPPSMYGVNPSFHISSLFAMFDAQDNFHIVASVMHYEGTSGYTIPAQIWHYCPANTPAWSLVHHYDAETLNAAVGYNAIFATRPSIVQNPNNNHLYVVWEQFDSLNFEPLTSRARADIYVAESHNNGQTWIAKKRITAPNTMSKRFPIAGGVQVTPSPSDPDTLLVMYLADSIAGAFLQAEHRFCVNPIVVHRVPVPLPTGIEEQNALPKYYPFMLSPAMPNPTNKFTNISYSIPTTDKVNLTIYDVLGRPVKTLVSGVKSAGEYSVTWDGTDDVGKNVHSGIYFYSLKTSDRSITHKLIKTN